MVAKCEACAPWAVLVLLGSCGDLRGLIPTGPPITVSSMRWMPSIVPSSGMSSMLSLSLTSDHIDPVVLFLCVETRSSVMRWLGERAFLNLPENGGYVGLVSCGRINLL